MIKMFKKLKIAGIVTECKYEFKIASNPCIIAQRREEKRREENFSAQLFLSKCFNIYVQAMCACESMKTQKEILLWEVNLILQKYLTWSTIATI